ncbi:uncharacterized protein [Amphiura filiformis]|uniref:uncharacterized protein n=1 Tax=Amphiura filiformis TaxID=82378 RepID=UPI003B2141CB
MELVKFVSVFVLCLVIFPYESTGRPNKEVYGNCRVADFQVQVDFQVNRYVGTWYHIAQTTASSRYQRRSHYSLLKFGGGLNMRTTRILGNLGCSIYEFNAVSRAEDRSVPAKMNLLLPNGPRVTEPYWVLHTDYDNIAVIYSCHTIVPETGECQAGREKAWVIGRTTQLTDEQLQYVQQLLEGVCVDPARLHFVPSDCDVSLGISSPLSVADPGLNSKLKENTHSCVVDGFTAQENLNINKYLGTWYSVAHVQPREYPYQRKSVYSLTDEGAIAMATQRISRDGECSTRHFEAVAYWPRGSTNSAKLVLNVTGMAMPPEDYWVLYVDYDAYAIVYSCSERNRDGTCSDNAKHVWVMSRVMVPLSDEELVHVEKVLQDVCVQPRLLEVVPNGCDSVLDLITGYGHGKEEEVEEIIETEEIEISCAVDDFQVQDNFVVEQFVGEWYNIKFKNPAIYEHQTSFRTIEFSASKDKSAAHMDVTIKDMKIGDMCGIAKNQAGRVWVSDTTPAKLTISFQVNGQQPSDVGGWNFWIVATDYANYAVAYACHEIGEFNTCDLKAEEIWVLSRRPSLPERYQYHIDNAVQYVCMEPEDLVNNDQPCHQKPVKNTLNLKKDKNAPQIPAELNTRTCAPSTAEYGCCLLEDKLATGPNYEGCPRVPPPVAGQPLPGEPQEIREPGECDDKIRCKMSCQYGFAIDAYGCEICKCAQKPPEESPANIPAELISSSRNCDPSTAKFGCCLLEDKPAAGPNYEGCPHVAPPVAGQPLPGGPQEIREPRQCDDKIRCKMSCQYGFATDAYGCEICKCAQKPSEQNTEALEDTQTLEDTQVLEANFEVPEIQTRQQLTECQEQRKFMLGYLKENAQTTDYYLPECDEQGLFQVRQCYADTIICWCVEPTTGSVVIC